MGRSEKPSREELERLAVERHLHGGRHLGAGPIFGAGRGRKRRGDVRAALLRLLAEEPRNGYQLMQAIEERSGGRWRPSPGSVYPTLAQLEDEGLIRATERDGAKAYEVTDAGRDLAGEAGERSAPWEGECDAVDELSEALHSLTRQLHLAVRQVAKAGDAAQLKQAAELLAHTKRDLYRILAEDDDG